MATVLPQPRTSGGGSGSRSDASVQLLPVPAAARRPSKTYANRDSSAAPSAFPQVVDRRHFWLARIHAELVHDGHERPADLLELPQGPPSREPMNRSPP